MKACFVNTSIISLFLICLLFSGCCPCKGQMEPEATDAAYSTHQQQTASHKAASDGPMFDYRLVELDNGLDVITLEDFSCPIVAVQVWYHVGSKNENPKRQGFAHMFEHMMFRGTDKLGPTDHFGFLRKVGGSTNGYTSFDRTVYLETVPASQLNLALWLEAERMAFLKIDQEAFDTERKVVEEERRMGLSEPYGSLYENLFDAVYKVHPYRWTPIGKIPHLRSSSVRELRDFWNKYYVPSNATLIIAGAVSHEDAQQAARDYFGWIPKYDVPQGIDITEPDPAGPRDVVLKEDNAPAPGVGVVYRTVPMKHPDAVVFDVIAQVVGSGNSSRLYRELVAEKQLAVGAAAESYNLEQDGLIGAGAVMPPIGADANQVLDIVVSHFTRLQTDPISEKELLKAKNQLMRSVVTQNLKVEQKARLLGSAALDVGDVASVNTYLAQINAVTADDVMRAANQYLTNDRSLRVRVNRNIMGTMFAKAKEDDSPITAEVETDPPAPGRPGVVRPADYPQQPPFSDATPDNIMPQFSTTTLANGLKVMVVENHEVPFVTVRLGFLNGSWTEEKNGACSMAMKMLTQGTKNYDEATLAEELETYAINLDGLGSMDTSMVSMSTLTDNIDKAMVYLGEVVLNPVFPETEFERIRRQVLTQLQVSSAEPEYLVEKEFRKRLYGDHPYSRTAVGEVEDVNALGVNDLKKWWKDNLRPDCGVLIFAGDIDSSKAFALAAGTFGSWKAAGAKPQPRLASVKQPDKTRIYIVDRPGSIQSQIRVGHLGITRHDERYFTSRVVSGYFGWAFNSRLNQSLRVSKGLTYGSWGGFTANRFAGEYKIGTFTKTESTADAVKAIIEEIERLKTEPATDKELDESKSNIVGRFVMDRETPQQVAGDLWLIESQQLPKDYIQQLMKAIAATDIQMCSKLTAEKVHENQLIIVVVGQADKLKDQLGEIAEVIVVSQDQPTPEV